MTIRKALQDIRKRLDGMAHGDRIDGMEINIVERDKNGEIFVVGRSYLPLSNRGGEPFNEEYSEGDPRRVKWEAAQ